jgi:hypothetical protein
VVLPTDQEVQVLAEDLELSGLWKVRDLSPLGNPPVPRGQRPGQYFRPAGSGCLQRTAAGKTPLILLLSLSSLLSYLPPKGSVIAPMVMNFQIGNPLRAKDVLAEA